MKNETCDVLVVAGLGVMEEPLWVEEAELIELLLPRAPKVLCEPFSCCDGAWSLLGKGRLDLTILWSGANSPKVGSHWKYL